MPHLEIRKVPYTPRLTASSIFMEKPSQGRAMVIRSVLLVDDDGRYRRAMASFFEARDDVEAIYTVASGQAALDFIAAQDEPPHVVLLDLFMPGMSGLEALPVLRQQLPPQTGIIVLSTSERQAYEGAVRAAGADAFVSKIDSATRLPKVMHEVCKRRKKTTQGT